ncbi:hypothetical protein IHE45_14G060700 [Dioscorea alata]|uniref:Uncharacterized protein n=1 Tax=Dioscorea alata TaxID=55571 RepID=A0ACB7US80_DIOAL|nr:hypothetical protein IHE45_14G060700 [Dioscorea alata]
MVYGRHPKRPAVHQPSMVSERRYDQHIRHAIKYMLVDKSTVILDSSGFSKAASHEAHIDVHGVVMHGVNEKLTWVPPFETNLLPRVEQNNVSLSHVIETSMCSHNIVSGPICSTHSKSKLLKYLLHPDDPHAPLVPDSKLLGPDHLFSGLDHI